MGGGEAFSFIVGIAGFGVFFAGAIALFRFLEREGERWDAREAAKRRETMLSLMAARMTQEERAERVAQAYRDHAAAMRARKQSDA